MTLAGIGGLGPWELLIVLAIVLVVFGAGKLPAIGGSLGQALRNFKKGVKGEEPEKGPEKNKETKH
ncbi:MAG TPA: twin-arginine translocase TatA/TatE family subunit [bacterium]|nr:twin-arginine translocase TatA/TatE family subunit [bacterium]